MPRTLLQGRHIDRRHGARTVLHDVDLRVDATSRVGLVGPNGAGKSTLLRVLAGEEPPDAGDVVRAGTVGHLPQLAEDELGRPARAVVLERLGVTGAAARMDALAARLADGDLDVLDAHAEALDAWLALGGADADPRLDAAAAELGLEPTLLGRPLAALSGGQAARAGLAAIACARHDVLLLDEPTNHLDADGLARLRTLLGARTGGVVLVSHDRALLAATCDELIELDPRTGRATHHAGGWDAYEHARSLARRQAQAAHDEAVARRAQLTRAADEARRRASASARNVRPGGSRDGDKHGREWVEMRADGVRARARVIADRVERIDVPDAPWVDVPPTLALPAPARRSGAEVALEQAVLARGTWSVGPLDVAVAAGDRLRIAGRNGAGKSTVLAALAGTLAPAAGERRVAPGARIGLLGQDRDALLGDASLAAAVRVAADATEQDARGALAAMGLAAEVVLRPAATLSPGERTRAELALLALRGTTCLLLDEPTNHLDVASLEVVEAALAGWPGALVVATHDERLAEALALSREVRLR